MVTFNYPVVHPTLDNKYVLVEDYHIAGVNVPKGYVTNGANIPRLLWWWVPPFKPKYLHAVVVHDYLCDLEDYKKADDMFEHCLKIVEDTLRIRLIVATVRLYHRIKYGVR